MKIAVLGLWHLGSVTAACCARYFTVAGLDPDPENIRLLQNGRAPLHEPGLNELLKDGLDAGRLHFTTEAREACANADILWVTCDTPVDENDEADVPSVLNLIRTTVPHMPDGTLVLLSSQLPVGTCRLLGREFGRHRFACSPENLRLGKAIEVFTRPDRIVAGFGEERTKVQLGALFAPFASQIVWMSPESAEMTKHAINSFLAVSISFMNEIARLCEITGANAREVEQGLKSESRIGPKAYLSPGAAFAGGTLARDVVTLTALGQEHGEVPEVLAAAKRSNDRHRGWNFDKIQRAFPSPQGKVIVLLGLTYKPGTDTLRRSSAVELAHALAQAGFTVRASDPSRPVLSADLAFIQFGPAPADVLPGADAVVVCTEWPEFRLLDWPALIGQLRQPLILDASRFLEKHLSGLTGVKYVSVGSSS